MDHVTVVDKKIFISTIISVLPYLSPSILIIMRLKNYLLEASIVAQAG